MKRNFKKASDSHHNNNNLICTRLRFIFRSFATLVITLLFITYITISLPPFSSVDKNNGHFIPKEKLFNEKPMQTRRGLEANEKHFTLNGEKFRIFSGAMHYFRIPPEYWFDRLSKLKAAGLNTVETYVPWNLHEQEKGHYDFLGPLDIARYVSLAHELGLHVIIRPGPYICSEWEWGGLPAWLLEDPNMNVRSTYKGYTQAVEVYFSKLLPRIVPLQYSKGGAIIAMQIENEYGSYGHDKEYLKWCKSVLERYGVTEMLFTSDGGTMDLLHKGSLPGIYSVVNFQSNPEENLDVLSTFQPDKPLMVGEFWTGWFDYWGDKRHTLALSNYTESLETILSRDASFNLYMFHGGTNFGFMNGANFNRTGENLLNPNPPYMITITSYDYDAPLSESGQITEKYVVTQQLMKKYNPKFTLTPELKKFLDFKTPTAKEYGGLVCRQFIPLTESLNLFKPLGVINKPTNVENLCKEISGSCSSPYYGFVAYRKKADFHSALTLTINGIVRDRMQIILDGKLLSTIFSHDDNIVISKQIHLNESGQDLILLVENMGRVNYDKEPNKLNHHWKGFMGSVLVNGSALTQWTVYDLSLKPGSLESLSKQGKWNAFGSNVVVKQPGFYRFTLNITDDTPADTFVNFEGWGRGAVFVNTKNIGRYSKAGPQKTLYLPGPYLKNGQNEIILFELHEPKSRIVLNDSPELGEACVLPCSDN